MKTNTAKKILSFVLCVLMLSSVLLTSCQEEGEKQVTQIRLAKSIVMAVVCEKVPDAETELAVEEAFNSITKSQFKTQVDIRFFTEEEYLEEIIALMERIKADNLAAEEEKENNSNNSEETEAVTEEETAKNEEYGYAETVYPEFLENQLDVLYIGGYDMFNFLYQGDEEFGSYLARLDEDLSTNSKLIKDFVFPEYMETCKVNGSTYAIPNNAITTEFTYLLVNKELAAKYQYSENMKSWKSIVDAGNFINDIAKYENGIAPIFGKPEPTNVHFWSYDEGKTLGWFKEEVTNPETGEVEEKSTIIEYPSFSINSGKFSVFGSAMPNDCQYGYNLGCGLTLSASNTYAKQLLEIQKFKDNKFVHETLADDQKFAVGFVKGNESDISKYSEDYEVIICESPRFTARSVFDSMFGVSAFSKTNVDRNMEIITAINTNPQLRNILQYGIENVNYKIDSKTGMLERLNDKYLMDINKTGNVFIAHPEEGITPKYMEMAKKQNVAAELYPCAGFNATVYTDGLGADYITQANALSAKYQAKLDACKSAAELEAVFAEFAQDKEVKDLQIRWNETNSSDPDGESEAKVEFSPYALYYEWLEANKFLESEEG